MLAPLLTVSVTVLVVVVGLGLKEADTPVGNVDVDKLTLPVKPPDGWIVIVDVPELPRETLRLLGDAERLKLGAVFTVRVIVVVCVRPGAVPVTVTVKVPVVALLFAESVSVLVEVAGFGLNVPVTPLGKPEAENVTLLLKPFDGVMVMVLRPLVPRAIVTLVGDADMLKSAWPAEFTVRLTLVV